MNILFYSSINSRSKDTESLMKKFVEHGHEVYLLTQIEGGVYCEYATRLGVHCFEKIIRKRSSFWSLVLHAVYLRKFVRRHKIDLVFAHLEPPSFSAVLAQYFIKAKVYICRHHVDEVDVDGTFMGKLSSRIIYLLARKVIVVSNRSKQYMVEKEGVNPDKIIKINLGYDFKLWPAISEEQVAAIRQRLATRYVFLCASRLIKSKRVHLAIQLIAQLRARHVDVGMYVLGKGEEQERLRDLVRELGLENHIVFEGYVDNVLDYMKAADLFVHYSIIDSSAAITKEAGLAHTPVLVCEDVGDFSEYIVEGHSGFLVSRAHSLEESMHKLQHGFFENENQAQLGDQLNRAVIQSFSIDNVFPEYLDLIRKP